MRLGFALPRAERFFNRFHREVITAARPGAAREPTTEGGMSVSADLARQPADALCYAKDKALRLGRKARQRIGQRALTQESPDDPDLTAAARRCTAFGASVTTLRARGVLASSIDEAAVPDRYRHDTRDARRTPR